MSDDAPKVWVMPPGSEILGFDGRQAFYVTEDGSGSVVSLPGVVSVELKLAEVDESWRP